MIVKQDNTGLQVLDGPPNCSELCVLSQRQIRSLDVCKSGLLAFSDNHSIKVHKIDTFDVVFEKNLPGIQFVKLSPKGNILAAWHPYKAALPGTEGEPNLHIFGVESGTLLQSLVQKKMTRWSPQWTEDESVSARLNNTELLFYEQNSFERYKKRLDKLKAADFSLTTNTRTQIHYVACYTVGTKGQPNFVRIFQYPNFEGNGIANKSFFKADTVTFLWNARGDSLLLLCATDVDKTGKSYYGEQALHFLDVNGQSYVVKLDKDGPIHNVAWTPSARKESYFCVIYGFLPAKAAFFNCKSEKVFELDELLMINQVLFNPFGNLAVFCGFGNLRGGVHVWDVDKKRFVSQFKCPETTDISWCPDGIHIMTATTTPRLRVGNGFKIIHYTGNIVHSWPPESSINLEVYKVLWQPDSDGNKYKEPVVTESISITDQKKKAAQQPAKYVPPALRKNQPVVNKTTSTLSEGEKRVKTLEKKLADIKKLKELRDSGKQLEKNQLQKIEKEDELENELMNLKLNS
ncbi:eukaryotic translation initiation factor 2A-like protein [Leptotrombidium deliense]|uniref:Eukaryotic translation initiation factor 2A n=1 Tax=Leptotrombidium deliense TaxID=299467 RepID=A0A443S5J6_9ACAR|nr:eukaryotic translation initiation factor 2A-like protein [Leptotrombidium deliense]